MAPGNSDVQTAPLLADGPACKPNISPRGRRRRRRGGFQMTAAAVVLLSVLIAVDAAWYWRALVFFPVTLAGFGFIQARRNTCVARAREGTFESDDYSKRRAPDDEVAASRRVARGIRRDAVLLGLAAAIAAVATATVR